MATFWAKMPISWIRYDRKLCEFRVSDIGASIAALKLYIVFALRANYKTANGVASGAVVITYDQIETLTQMSRALVSIKGDGGIIF